MGFTIINKILKLGCEQCRMKKIFFVGDFLSNTGPANVNKSILKVLNENAEYSLSNNKLFRIVELVYKTLKSEYICFCSFSKIDYYGIKIAKLLHKKTFYLMHGYLKMEYQLDNIRNDGRLELEQFILYNVDKVFCVSETFKDYMSSQIPDIKFDFANNGIDWNYIDSIINNSNDERALNIISAGGTLHRKSNKTVSDAVEALSNKHKNIRYYIVGQITEKDEYTKNHHTILLNTLSQEEYFKLMKKSRIYIQNSKFEPFGLAPIEALACGCDLLISSNVGAKCILKLKESDIICDNDDVEEIREKIEYLISNSNNERIEKSLNKKKTSVEQSVYNLYNKIINS